MLNRAGEEKGGRLACLLLLQLVSGYALACAGFLLGVPVGGWQFVLSAAVAVGFGFASSLRTGWTLLALNALALLLTAFTFSYVHCDASICHVPMAHFLSDGWNPVRGATLETVRHYYAAHGLADIRTFDALHVLVNPKFSQILAAQVQSVTGLFSAAGHPLWISLFALALTAWRFARTEWSASRLLAGAFAAILCVNPIVFEPSLRGLVDFTTYAALTTGALTLLLWRTAHRLDDLVLFFAAMAIALVNKFTGVWCAVLLLVTAAILGRREKAMRWAFLAFAAALLLLLVLPYGTALWHHGTPFWPAQTVRPEDALLPNLTDDFIPTNADGLKMGFLARTVYAWVSKDLALWACRLYHAMPAFDPQWDYFHHVSGVNGFFCVLLWTPVVLAFFVRRNAVTLLAGVLLVSCFVLPVKYIGCARYVAHIFAAAVLLWFNFIFAVSGRGRRPLQGAAVLAAAVFLGYGILAFLAQLRDEGVRQRNLARLADPSFEPYRIAHADGPLRYVMHARLPAEAAAPVGAPLREITSDWFFFPMGEGLLPYGAMAGFPLPVLAHPHHTTCLEQIPQ